MKGKIEPLKLPVNDHILWLPSETHSITLNAAIELHSAIVKAFKIPGDYLETIQAVKDSKLALEFANLAIKRVKTQEKRFLKCLLENYRYEELKDHELFKDYKISEYGSLIHKFSKVEIFFEYSSIHDNSAFLNQFIAKNNIFHLAVTEKHVSLMEEVTKDIFKTAHVALNLFKATNQEYYPLYLNSIARIVQFVIPKFQPDIIRQLAGIADFGILSFFSEILLNNKQYEEVITLLEPRLPNLVNRDQEEESEAIHFCRYNLSAAYDNTGKVSLAEEQLLRILKDRPQDSDSIYRLFDIYLINYKVTKAKNLIKNAPIDLKILMEMSLEMSSISETKLNLINQNNLPNDSKEQFRCFQYVAKYNSASEKIRNDENLKDELAEISNSITDTPILLFTIALYTKQYELARQFIKAIPQDRITPYLNTFFKEIEFLLTPKEYIYQIYIEDLINKLHFSQEEAIDLINEISQFLIEDEKYELAIEKVQEVLKYDSQNYNTLEIGLKAASLSNNLEKIKQYLNLQNQEQREEIINTYDDKEVEPLINQNDPKKIHEYYQSVKEINLLNAISKVIPGISYNTWKINNISLGKYKGLDCYGKISTKLKLDKNQYDKFENALEKGIIYRQQGKDGVKFIGNKAVEIKIDGDQRLYTNILHYNERGELLINFDHQGNHNDVMKFVGEHHLEFHQDLL